MTTCSECGGLGEIVEPIPRTAIKTHRGKLERGWRRTWLIQKLAEGEAPYIALAECMGVSDTAIKIFAKRHMDEILVRRDEMTEELASLWITSKLNRLAEYQQDLDDIRNVIEDRLAGAEPAADPLDPAEAAGHPELLSELPGWFRVKGQILRAVAEELGQLPQKVQVQVGGTVATYRIEGVPVEQV